MRIQGKSVIIIVGILGLYSGISMESGMRKDNKQKIKLLQLHESPVFWGWLFQFGERMRILSPESMVNECRERVRELGESYGS